MLHNLRRNVADLPRAFSFSSFVSGLVAVLVGYAGPLLLVFQASDKAGLDRAHLSSWISAVALGCGICALSLSLYYRKPILIAWPTAGVALLIASIANYAYPEVIGAYILSGIGLAVLGWSKFRTQCRLAIEDVKTARHKTDRLDPWWDDFSSLFLSESRTVATASATAVRYTAPSCLALSFFP